jgi:hypothetical protein
MRRRCAGYCARSCIAQPDWRCRGSWALVYEMSPAQTVGPRATRGKRGRHSSRSDQPNRLSSDVLGRGPLLLGAQTLYSRVPISANRQQRGYRDCPFFSQGNRISLSLESEIEFRRWHEASDETTGTYLVRSKGKGSAWNRFQANKRRHQNTPVRVLRPRQQREVPQNGPDPVFQR